MAATAVDARRPVLTPISRVAIAAVGAYVGAQVIADVASLKIGVVADRAVDMGTFIYPITFTLRDVVHKALGKRAARTVIVTAAAVNLFMAFYLQWAARAPSRRVLPAGRRVPGGARAAVAHHDRVDRRRGRERAGRHRGVPLVRATGDDAPPVGPGGRQQRGEHADRQRALRACWPSAPSRACRTTPSRSRGRRCGTSSS